MQARGVACYRQFISALLDVTDNLVDGEIVPPTHVVRHDGDDPYLVVAADKGTATFSDIANEISAEYDFWLGDAFASGGSAGYDHKKMGITARGAWEAVKRHFRELNGDISSRDFRVGGIGDMSGDVFGNGMLLSPHIRLVAAFDHRDVFVDPAPDAARSFVERRRLFELKGSSWDDYDRALISPGGGVWPRTAKSVPVSAHMRAALGIDDPSVTSLSPAELIRAILRAPVDLLWNGGIGTYVKASDESQPPSATILTTGTSTVPARSGRREGGNLGLTQRGRVEYCLGGGPDGKGGASLRRLHLTTRPAWTAPTTVNIRSCWASLNCPVGRDELLAKIPTRCGRARTGGQLRAGAGLCLRPGQAASLLPVHRDGHRDGAVRTSTFGRWRRCRATISSARRPRLRLTRRSGRAHGVHEDRPGAGINDSPLPDDEWTGSVLVYYFPTPLRERTPTGCPATACRREMVTPRWEQVVNRAASRRCSGPEETVRRPADVIRAYVVVRDVYGLPAFWRAVERLTTRSRRRPDRDPLEVRAGRPCGCAGHQTAAPHRRDGRDPPLPPGRGRAPPDLDRLFQAGREALRAPRRRVCSWRPAPRHRRGATRLCTSFGLLDIVGCAETGRTVQGGRGGGGVLVVSGPVPRRRPASRISDLPRSNRCRRWPRCAALTNLYAALAALTPRDPRRVGLTPRTRPTA